MEDQNVKPIPENNWEKWEKQHKRGSIIGGIFVVIFGALFLARELGAVIPDWAISWKTILIAIGLAIGIKSNFRRLTWLVFVGVGTAFFVCDLYPEQNLRHIIWPMVIIFVGMVMIFKPRRKWDPERWGKWRDRKYHGKNWEEWCDTKAVESGEDRVSSTTVFGGVKKNIISKDFKGGEIVNVFGGSEYNLSQADFNGTITIEIVQFFGGTKLIVPSNWEIKSELVAVIGGIEDNRPIQTNVTNTENKVLVLNGTTVFGGIQIRS